MNNLAEMVSNWDLAGEVPVNLTSFSEAHKRVEFFYAVHFYQYIPTLSAEYLDFEHRLGKWLENVASDEQKQLLLELVVELSFFSREEFAKLHTVAFDGPVLRWLIEELGLTFGSTDFDENLAAEARSHTWYCPITDSMQISDFHHANGLGGTDFRPDWRSLVRFGDPKQIEDYMLNRTDATGRHMPLKRIVLLEDFVGSGTQMQDAVRFASSLPGPLPILLLPLVICPKGAALARQLESTYANVTYSPVIELKESDMVIASQPRDGSLFGKIADLVESTYADVVGDDRSTPRPYDPFGFPPGNGTGALVILYSNTPANSLPILQHDSNTWNPLFPRSARIR